MVTVREYAQKLSIQSQWGEGSGFFCVCVVCAGRRFLKQLDLFHFWRAVGRVALCPCGVCTVAKVLISNQPRQKLLSSAPNFKRKYFCQITFFLFSEKSNFLTCNWEQSVREVHMLNWTPLLVCEECVTEAFDDHSWNNPWVYTTSPADSSKLTHPTADICSGCLCQFRHIISVWTAKAGPYIRANNFKCSGNLSAFTGVFFLSTYM